MRLKCNVHSWMESIFFAYKDHNCNSSHLIDEWTLVHFLSVVIFKILFPFVSLFWILIIHIIFELIENSENGHAIVNAINPHLYSGDSWINAIGDTIVFVLGAYLVKSTPYLRNRKNYLTIFTLCALLYVSVFSFDYIKTEIIDY